jgi:hypothetical protein
MPENKNTDWKQAEQLAAILEKFITPDSTVEHNVMLPVIGRSDRKPRQCDVVITFGREPRKTIAIVEVQKRETKPSIATFHSWITKMEEVGAQQLICVSNCGYPESIVNEVKNRHGLTKVTLMKLEEFDYLTNPEKYNILPYQIMLRRKFQLRSLGKLELQLEPINRLQVVDVTIPMFTLFGSSKKLNASELACEMIDAISNTNPKFRENEFNKDESDISIEIDLNSKVSMHLEEGTFLIKSWILGGKFYSDKEIRETNLTQYSYRQEFIDGAIAWIAKTNLIINGQEQDVEILFKTDEGKLTISAPKGVGFTKIVIE